MAVLNDKDFVHLPRRYFFARRHVLVVSGDIIIAEHKAVQKAAIVLSHNQLGI